MRLLALTKFPPLTGGTSTNAYWTLRAAVEDGHDVDVVTNAAETEVGYKQHFWGDDHTWLRVEGPNGSLRIHNTSSEASFYHLPQSNPYASKLLGLGLAIADRNKPDLIFGCYLEPY